MITALLIGAGALWLIGRKRNGVAGIGAAKRAPRRIWSEVEWAQKNGIDLTDPDGWQKHTKLLRSVAEDRIKTESNKPKEQRYFNQLRRAYKSIAGTNLPYKENVVRNEYDDVILVYRDYELDKLPSKAADWMRDQWSRLYGGADDAYWHTIADIASGRVKFAWKGDGKIHRGAEGLIFGQAAPMEKKKRISYLATPAKGGRYPEEYAHYLWETVFQQTSDDQEITNGVLEAIRTCESKGQAQQMCVDEYLKAFQVQDPMLYQDVPF